MSYVMLLQYLLYMDLMNSGSCTMSTAHCVAMKSGSPLRPYNRVCNTAGITEFEVESIQQFFGMTPFTWVVDAQDAHTISVLESQELYKVAEFPAMHADIGIPSFPLHENQKLVLSEAQLPDEVALWIEHTAGIYSYATPAFSEAVSYLRVAGGNAVKLYMGSCNDDIICTGMMIYHGPVVTLHVIGTLPAYRSRGFGYDFTVQLLGIARHTSCTQAVLFATDAGKSLYNRLGFVPYATYYFYTVPL